MVREKDRRQDARGAIMLESLIVVSMTVFLLFFVLASFATMFQRFNIQIIANETAARLAQTYEYALKADATTGDISLDDAVAVDKYRYFKGAELETATNRKAKEYASARLKKTTFTKDVKAPTITASVTPDSLGRRHLKVVIKGSYRVPFSEILEYFGMPDINDYETVAYAECIDLSNYVNVVGFIDKWTSLDFLGSKLINMVNSVFSMLEKFGL